MLTLHRRKEAEVILLAGHILDNQLIDVPNNVDETSITRPHKFAESCMLDVERGGACPTGADSALAAAARTLRERLECVIRNALGSTLQELLLKWAEGV